MLKTMIAAALLATASGVAAQVLPRLDWRVSRDDTPGEVQLTLEYRTLNSRSMHNDTTPLAELSGLTAAQLASAGGTPVRFRIDRDAGTLDCDGIAQGGKGIGECRFTPGAAFAAALARQGGGPATPMQLFTLALTNIGRSYLDELQRQRYARPSVDDLVAAGNHGASLTYLKGIGAQGYRPGTVAALVRMRDHGVTPAYVERLAGYGVRTASPDTIVRLRDHGVSADYVGELQALGYKTVDIDQLADLRDHGVSASYIRGLKEAGYSRFTAAGLIRLRDNGVSSGFVGALASEGYRDLSADQLVRLASHGVTAGFVHRANAGGRRSVEDLVRLRAGGA